MQVFATRLLVGSVVHHRALDPAVLRYSQIRPIIQLQFALAGRAVQALDAVAVARDARNVGCGVACAGLAVGEGAEFGADVFAEEED